MDVGFLGITRAVLVSVRTSSPHRLPSLVSFHSIARHGCLRVQRYVSIRPHSTSIWAAIRRSSLEVAFCAGRLAPIYLRRSEQGDPPQRLLHSYGLIPSADLRCLVYSHLEGIAPFLFHITERGHDFHDLGCRLSSDVLNMVSPAAGILIYRVLRSKVSSAGRMNATVNDNSDSLTETIHSLTNDGGSSLGSSCHVCMLLPSPESV